MIAAHWSPGKINTLHLRVALAVAMKQPEVYLPFAGTEPVSVDYAKHVLSCLKEAQTDTRPNVEAP